MVEFYLLTPSENSSHCSTLHFRRCVQRDGDGGSARPSSCRLYCARPDLRGRSVAISKCCRPSLKRTQIVPYVRRPRHSSPPLRRLPPYFQLRDGLVCAWRWSAGPHMTQGHGIRLFHDHACPIGVGYSHSSPFPSFPTWPHCDRFFVQVKWS